MPDSNKLAALKANSYKIVFCCALCEHAQFSQNNAYWGTCSLITYQHLKHTGIRQASIHKSGYCPQFKIDSGQLADLTYSGFDQFLEKNENFN